MKKIKIEKLGGWWYARVFSGENLLTQAGFKTRKAATECRAHWITEKVFGEAEEG